MVDSTSNALRYVFFHISNERCIIIILLTCYLFSLSPFTTVIVPKFAVSVICLAPLYVNFFFPFADLQCGGCSRASKCHSSYSPLWVPQCLEGFKVCIWNSCFMELRAFLFLYYIMTFFFKSVAWSTNLDNLP